MVLMKRLNCLLILVMLITGCSPTIEQAVTPNPTNIVKGTATFHLQTSFPTYQSTSTETNPHLDTQCMPILESIPAGFTSEGVLVAQNQARLRPPSREVYILDIKNNRNVLANLPMEGIQFGKTSPDGKWIAYSRNFWDSAGENIVSEDITISSLNGQTYKFSPKKVVQNNPDWLFLLTKEWLDNNHLLVGLNVPNQNILGTLTVFVWDPFTGEKQVIKPDFPELYDTQTHPFPSWGYGVVVYNPSLTRALYFRSEDGLSGFQYVLWDMNKGESIASFPIYDVTIDPRWSPDGTKVAIVDYKDQEEISIIDDDGQLSQLTHIGDSYKYVGIRNLYWSPDGNHIAFSLWSKLSDDDVKTDAHIATLAVADATTGKVTNTCIPIGANYGGNLDMVWSPNGKQLVVKDESVDNYNRLILVDIERGVAMQIAENMDPFGWMVPQE